MSTLPLKSILCVEDNKDARELMLTMLAGYRTVFAANGYEAIREFHKGFFDAYMLDQWLPDWSGVQLCREIRKTDPRGAIFFCTGAARKEDRLRAMRAGADVYLTKPIDPEQLLRQLRVHLETGEIESLRAKVDEEAAIQLELERRTAAAAQRVSVARESAERAIERTQGRKHSSRSWGPAARVRISSAGGRRSLAARGLITTTRRRTPRPGLPAFSRATAIGVSIATKSRLPAPAVMSRSTAIFRIFLEHYDAVPLPAVSA